MALFGTATSAEILTHPKKSLAAEDYVFSPQHQADLLIKEWLVANPGFMHKSTPAMKDLRERLISKLRQALEEGRKTT